MDSIALHTFASGNPLAFQWILIDFSTFCKGYPLGAKLYPDARAEEHPGGQSLTELANCPSPPQCADC